MTTAPTDNRGGYQVNASQNNFGVSAVGGNGSADGVPNINYTGFAYKENKAVNEQMGAGLPMGAQTPASFANEMITAGSGNPINTLLSETDNINEPVTTGAPIGPGAGPEILPKNISKDSRALENRAIVEKYMPLLFEGTKVQGAPESYKQFINFLMEQ